MLVHPVSYFQSGYLLRATFNADDQGYADAQVLDTVAEGVQAGQLTVVEVDGTLAIVSNKCKFTAQSSPVYTDLGFYSAAKTKSLGLTLLGIINLSTWEEMGVAWHDAAAVVDPDNSKYAIQANTTDGRLDVEGGVQVVSGLSLSTDYKFAIVLGGSDTNAVPFKSGDTKSDFKYGASYFYQDGTNWILLWRNLADNTATLYAMLSSLDAVGTLDDFRVPDKDLSAVLQPAHLSTFTASNGTSLDAITPEVGNAWVFGQGTFQIQSNRVETNSGNETDHAYVDDGESDVIVDCIVEPFDDGTNRAMPCLVVRQSDADNLWFARVDSKNNEVRLIERNAAGQTTRATATPTINSGTDYDLRIICDGQTIDCFFDGGDKISYASATLNETATRHGVYYSEGGTPGTSCQWENFAVFPRTATVYDTELNAV